MGNNSLYAFVCVLVSAAAVLITNPTAEIGLFDDWAYTLAAKQLAQEGLVRFHGWETAFSFLQAGWATLWIRAFGFSYTLVRLTTLLFAVGCTGLLYLSYRMAELSPRTAIFGTLFLALSPVFLPLAASFMTDVPGMFLLLAVLCCYSRAANARMDKERPANLWLSLATLLAIIGGTNRQTIWLAPLVLLPYIGVTRGTKQTRLIAALLWFVSVGVIGLSLRWQSSQPYSIQDSVLEQIRQAFREPGIAVEQASHHLFKFVLLLLPVLLGTPFLWTALRRLPRNFVAVAATCAAMAGLLLISLGLGGRRIESVYLAPWEHGGDLVTSKGVLTAHLTTLGERPDILPEFVWVVLTSLVFFACLIMFGCFIQVFRFARPQWFTPAKHLWQRWPVSIRLLAIYSLAYLAALQPRLLSGNAFDRYHLPLLLLAAIALLWHAEKDSEPGPGMDQRYRIAGWLLLAGFGLFAVTTTHDYLAMMRTIARAGATLQGWKIPRTAITAGFEYDCWTEAETSGYVNDPRIKRPAGAYRQPSPRQIPLVDPIPFWWDLTPSVRPQWFVSNSVQRQLRTPDFALEYHRWLPWGRGHIYAQRLPESMPPTPERK